MGLTTIKFVGRAGVSGTGGQFATPATEIGMRSVWVKFNMRIFAIQCEKERRRRGKVYVESYKSYFMTYLLYINRRLHMLAAPFRRNHMCSRLQAHKIKCLDVLELMEEKSATESQCFQVLQKSFFESICVGRHI